MKLMTILLFSFISGAVVAQTLSSDHKKVLRDMLETDFAKETQTAIEEFFAEAKNKGTEEERRLAIRGIKGMLYNKAYNQYRCILAHPTSFPDVQECSAKANRDLAVYFRLATQYFSTVAKRSMQCEMQSRLFEEEIDFPPYPFFEGARLFDHARMTECLRK